MIVVLSPSTNLASVSILLQLRQPAGLLSSRMLNGDISLSISRVPRSRFLSSLLGVWERRLVRSFRVFVILRIIRLGTLEVPTSRDRRPLFLL